jgi:glycosyltransferase involved in cell wall biosynthesis
LEKKSDHPLVSVIVPVYNVERYLKKSVSSILAQTLKSIEIILVNDGSTDGSGEIVNKYDREYDQIKLINKQNGGLSSARNEGLKHATGEYILFCDSDDYLPHNICETLYGQALKNNCDVVCCNVTTVDESGRVIEEFKVKKEGIFTGGVEATRLFLSGKLFRPSAYNKLVRKSLFEDNDLTFPYGLYFEDNPYTIKLLSVANRIQTISMNGYYYVRRGGSITMTMSPKHLEDTSKICDIAKNWLIQQKIWSELEKDFHRFCAAKWGYTLKIVIKRNPSREIFRLYKSTVPKAYWGKINLRYRLFCYLGMIWPQLPGLFVKQP